MLAKSVDVVVPDIGQSGDVDVIEVLVSPGDTIAVDTALVTLESDKASMDIPSPLAGVIDTINVAVGDKVQTGSLILTVKAQAEKVTNEPAAAPAEPEKPAAKADVAAPVVASGTPSIKEVKVPDIGNATDVEVIEITVKVGDVLTVDQAIATLESDKASMDIPSPYAGVVTVIKIAVGDKVSAGASMILMEVKGETSQQTAVQAKAEPTTPALAPKPAETSIPAASTTPAALSAPPSGSAHAGPAVRRFARELGVDLSKVQGKGPKGRVLKEDVQQYVKAQLQRGPEAGTGIPFGLPPLAPVDFSQWGEIETITLSRIKKISGSNLHRNWLQAPHITQFDEADITELEEFRKAEQSAAEKQGLKLTPLVFIMKAVVGALKMYPNFNASLDPGNDKLILKKYYHLGVAVDTPNGLMVPVVRDVDKKGFFELAKELAAVSEKARTKGLTPNEMQGSTFTLSSLGGIGGTAFTPIINLPNVAILGISRSTIKPVYKDGQFVPRLMLPLSLSYDHRVIDGAEGARFSRQLVTLLGDIRNLLL